jgi:hypothetical protein
MRLALAAVALLAAVGPGWAAGKEPCIARAHQGAMPWESDASGQTMHPFRKLKRKSMFLCVFNSNFLLFLFSHLKR